VSKVVLMAEIPGGDVVVVPFSDRDAAEAWETRHPEIEGLGVRQVMSQRGLASYLRALAEGVRS
jgi:hypothetical protein